MSSSPPSRNNAVLEEEVKALRKELEALKAAREEERNRYEHQVQEQQEHIMSLIEQLNQVETRRAAQPAVAAHKVVTHNVVTTKTVTTTRTASAAASATEQNTKVAVSSAAGGVPPKRKFVGNPSAAAPPPAQHAKGKFVKGSTAPVTALQHAWDKFCALARGEFTVKELSLVSCETLRNLMEHYNFRKPVEVAQVEAQWALLQEGQRAVPEPTLHDSAPKPHSEPYKPMISPEEFSLAGLDKRDKHFSHRPRILDEPVKRSDPNESAWRHADMLAPRGRGFKHYDPSAPSDPNDAPLRRVASATGRRSVTPDPPTHEPPQGKSRAYSPQPHAVSAYPEQRREERHLGVKQLPHKIGTEEPKRAGLRTGYAPTTDQSKKKSIRIITQKCTIEKLA